jgi:spore maturation protein CgeB
VTAFYDIDTPVTLAKLRSGDYEYLSPEIISQFDLYLSFTGGPLLQEIESWYGARRALPLYCSADEELYGPIRSARKWDLSYLGTYSPDRQPILARLMIEAARYSPRMRFVVAGPQYPEGIEWPGNIERLEHVSPADHAAFYSASRFTLNVTRRNMIDAGFSPSVRLFEAAACRCPVLSDYWNGLDAFFAPGREIIVCSDTKDVISALAMPEETGRDIAEAAHRRTMAGHTGTHRARELERYIRAARRQDVAADERVPLREGVT